MESQLLNIPLDKMLSDSKLQIGPPISLDIESMSSLTHLMKTVSHTERAWHLIQPRPQILLRSILHRKYVKCKQNLVAKAKLNI